MLFSIEHQHTHFIHQNDEEEERSHKTIEINHHIETAQNHCIFYKYRWWINEYFLLILWPSIFKHYKIVWYTYTYNIIFSQLHIAFELFLKLLNINNIIIIITTIISRNILHCKTLWLTLVLNWWCARSSHKRLLICLLLLNDILFRS